jgi:hypothetical protein
MVSKSPSTVGVEKDSVNQHLKDDFDENLISPLVSCLQIPLVYGDYRNRFSITRIAGNVFAGGGIMLSQVGYSEVQLDGANLYQ